MFCWQVRWHMSDLIEGDLSGAPAPRLRSHLEGCESCRVQLGEMERVASLVKECGSDPLSPGSIREAAVGFEDRVLRELRARSLGAHRAQADPRFLMAPVPLGIAIVSLAVVLVLGLYFGGLVATDGFGPKLVASGPDTETRTPAASAAFDEADIPFLVRQDLVGPRRGRIPTVTYVLEPAPEEPDEEAVLRASY